MILKGQKVILRPIEFDDLEFIRSLINDPEIEKSIVGWALPISKKDEENWYASFHNTNNEIRYIVEFEGSPVGLTGVASIDWKNGSSKNSGMRISPNVQRKGLATDAYMTMLKFLFLELRLHRSNASALEFNMASLRTLGKCGYKVEGLLRDAEYKNGRYHNVVTLGMLKDDYVKVAKEMGYL